MFSWTWVYVEESLVHQTKSIRDPLKCNNLPLFSRPPVREKSSKQLQLSTLITAHFSLDCTSPHRYAMVTLMSVSGSSTSNFKYGCLEKWDKSDLLSCLQDLMPVSENVTVQVTCTILDGAAIINMLQHGTTKTFHDCH